MLSASSQICAARQAVVPGSISTSADLSGRGAVSFQAIEAR